MGLADRDYMREPKKGRSRTSPVLAIALGALIAAALATGAAGRGIHWVRAQRHGPAASSVIGVALAPGVALHTASVPRHDPWSRFLAPEAVCPWRSDSTLPASAQQRTAICLLNYARQQEGLEALPESPTVSAWSALKAADIVRCDDFSHTPCGEDGMIHPREAGFAGSWGENIFAGPQVYKTPLAAVDGWLNSPHHRENLFRPEWRFQGISVVRVDDFRGERDVAIWVSEFTDR